MQSVPNMSSNHIGAKAAYSRDKSDLTKNYTESNEFSFYQVGILCEKSR